MTVTFENIPVTVDLPENIWRLVWKNTSRSVKHTAWFNSKEDANGHAAWLKKYAPKMKIIAMGQYKLEEEVKDAHP